MGLYIGVTAGFAYERRGTQLREVARFLPLDRLLLKPMRRIFCRAIQTKTCFPAK